MTDTGFLAGVRREIRRMASRKMYIFGMVAVPVLMAVFFLSLLKPGLPLKVPTAVVDLDHSSMSRTVTRSLNALELIDINRDFESYDEALAGIRRGEIYGFFVIPDNFEKDAIGGRTPTLEYYTNLTYFVPGTLSFKGFKTVAVSTAGSVVRASLVSLGVDPEQVGAMLQPIVIDNHPIGNPWLSYAIYLCPSFTFATFALMIMLMTVFSITMEIKNGTSVGWLATAKGRITVAVSSKLLTHTVVWFAIGLFISWLLWGWSHFPVNGSLGWLLAAVALLILACQAFGLFIASVVPNPRLAFSLTALFGILTFSFTGFSFPVQSMYGFLAVFSWLSPVRYFFMIYINEGLNGYPLFYSRMWYVALMLFPVVACSLLWRLKKACERPVYVP
ncbi:MAG: ABC transporter permease [Muribaculaceae bacterium]